MGVIVSTASYPSLAVKAVRDALGKTFVLLEPPPAPRVRIGEHRIPLDSDGQIRLRPSRTEIWHDRMLQANAVLADADLAGLRSGEVFVGGSLPERGGLRPTAVSPL